AVTDHGAPQAGDAKTPPANINRMNVIVAQLAIAGVPEPVPIIMKARPRQRAHWRRAGPEVVIHTGRNLVLTGAADGTPPSINNAAGQLDLTELAFVHVFNGLGQCAVGAVLCSDLANAAQLARRLHDAAAFSDVVADRFLNVHVLARLHGPDRRQGVPVVWRGNEDGSDRFVVENHAQILDGLGLGTLLFDQGGSQFGGAVAIRIAHVRNLAVRQPRQFAGVLFAADATADDGDGDLVVRARGLFFRAGQRHGKRCSRSRRSGQN